MGVQIINITKLEKFKLCQLIDLAGFKTIINRRTVTLIDKKNTKADEYSDLTFESLYEAVRAVGEYLSNQYKFVW
jgi:hypothetical protein